MSLLTSAAKGFAKSSTKIKAAPKAAKAMPGKVKVQGKAFGHAVKHTPGESLGGYVKEHRWGTGIAVVGTAADAADIEDNHRRSTHAGINQR